MSHHQIDARPFKTRRGVKTALLCGVSLIALTMGGDPGDARSLTPGSDTVAPTAAAIQAGMAAAQQGANAAAQAQASLARAAAALTAARNLQLDAAAAARGAQSSIPNGVRPGGLMQLNPAGFDAKTENCGASCTRTITTWKTDSSWTGANGPVETVQSNSSQVRVDIKQTQQKAILNWRTFNVGADTTVNFDQAASNWIALNRIDPDSGAPSRILGQVNAPGAIYLINRNGIIFGAGSQVNIHSLVASSLDIGKLGMPQGDRDRFFLGNGIAAVDAFSIYDAVGGAQTTLKPGDITVERGASIKANIASDRVDLGSDPTVYLFGANVTNSGSITAPTGEVAMLAARGVDLVPGGYSVLPEVVLGKSASGDVLKLRGTEFRISHFALSYNSYGYGFDTKYLAGTGGVRHDGLIDASQGIVIMNGDRVSVDNPRDLNGGVLKDATGNLVQGVISVDTSISRNSMVLLRAATSVTMNGVISSLPVDDGSEPLASGPSSSSTVPSFKPAYVEMTAQSTVAVGASGLVSAPSAQVALRAISLAEGKGVYKLTSAPNQPEVYGQRLFNQGTDATGSNNANGGNSDVGPNSNSPQTVLLAPGAVIDVAGLANVSLPASYNYIQFKPLAEYADTPLQRAPYDAPLYGNTFYIDIRASGTRSDGTRWVGTPLADASGYINNVGRSIYQLMTVGGSVTMKTDLTASAGVQTAGSVINVAGGGVKFESGLVNSTRLIGTDGRIYSAANADPNRTYLGVADRFVRNHERWGVTEIWHTGKQIYAPGYLEGHDAGSVIVNTVTPVLTGTMYFGSVAGERQIKEALLPLQGSLQLTTPSSVQIGSTASTNYTTQSPVTHLSADVLSGYGLSALTVTANDFVVSGGSTLNLAAGGHLSVTAGGAIDIAGKVIAAGGAINLVTDRASAAATQFFKVPTDESGAVIAANVFVGGTLDVSGRFVNETGLTGTDLTGAAFINGGSISITTNKFSDNGVDTTGSILLAAGSLLDVSSGGYVSSQGKPKIASTGVMAGKAGSISLAIYQGERWRDPTDAVPPIRPTPAVSDVAVLQLDGLVLGYGFEGNGSLRLAGADTIRIGGTLQQGETSAIRIGGVPSILPVSLFTGGGFGSYIIESVTDDWSGATSNVIVSAGTNLTLRQQNLSSLADYTGVATGTRLGQRGAPLAQLPDDQRKPVDLTLRADSILLDTGTAIVTDPQANIILGAVNPLRTEGVIRDVAATSVVLRGSIVNHGGTVFINSRFTRLGPQAVVDLSGTFVGNSRFGVANGPVTSGTYLAGGSFTVEAGQRTPVSSYINPADDSKNVSYFTYGPPGGGYLVAEVGATVDVSGAAGEVLIAGARGATSPMWSWSDAGTVSANVSGFAWGGSFVATGGRYAGPNGQALADGRANNGTFILGGGAIRLRQDNEYAKTQLSSPSALHVAANQLAPFDNVFLYSGVAVGGAARYFDELPGSIYNIPSPGFSALTIEGSVNWHVAGGLRIAAASIAQNIPNSTVALDAPYVLFTSAGGTSGIAGSSILNVNAQTIDVAGASFSGFSQVNLISSGDIRLRTPRVSNTIDSVTGTSTYPDSFSGKLATQGDLLLQAQRIYPVSAVNFTIQTPSKVTFAAPSGSDTRIPLSAGGSLTVFANTIEQGGNLFAPLGKINLGSTDTTVSPIVTQSVTLRPGSLTSVTLADTTVPYGATDDGSGWYYNASLSPLAQAPSKGIVLIGSNVTRSNGSVIDLRGGGELQAMEWIQGNGGSRDTLAGTPSGQTVYALLPVSDPVAAFDIHFTSARAAGTGNTLASDSYPMAGSQITIDGGNGIPAGTYTLYPAHYATLPGAMRVTHYGDTTGRTYPGGVLPDGTVIVTGNYTQSTAPGKQSSGQSLFAVQTNAVWRQYSEYSFSQANRYFTELAVKKELPVSRLPMDAGRLAVIAQQKIVLDGIALTQPGRDSSGNLGRGGELDISAPKLAVVGHAGYVSNDIPTGYVGIDIAQLEGFESILIGGLRSDTVKGTLITQNASSVLVDTKGEVFAAPEILLVAHANDPGSELQTIPQNLTVNGKAIVVGDGIRAPGPDSATSGTVTIAAGSVITASGNVYAGAGRNYYFADPVAVGTPTTAQQVATALGGTLDASGTVITGVDISRFSYLVKNADGSFVLNPDGSIYSQAGSADLTALRNYSYQTTGLGALFVATNDSSLKVSGPSGIAPASLTIQFASSNDPNAPGAVTGSLLLPADAGRLTIQSGATITAKSATMQATASTNAIVGNSGDLHLEQLNVTARTIGLGSPALISDKSVALYNQQFSDVKGLALKALSGVITLYGDFNPGAVSRLTLDAAAVVRAGSAAGATVSVTGNDGSITLVNTGAASPSINVPVNGSGHKLTLNASEIVLGGGTQKILGYGEVDMIAANRIFVAGPGSLALGAGGDVVNLNLAAQNVLVGGATASGTGSFAVTTSGNIALSDILQRDPSLPRRPADSAETGGKLSLTGADVLIGGVIQAQAGTITLNATAGNVRLSSRAYLAAGGYKKSLLDVDTYLSGGKVVLKSDNGYVFADTLSVIDVAQPADNSGNRIGYGGEIEASALNGSATFNGFLLGAGGPGLGGRFKLDAKGAVDLTALADRLFDGGVYGAIDIRTRTGNLELLENHTLKAHAVTLTADDTTWSSDPGQQFGQIKIRGRIDATGHGGDTLDGSGRAGGRVELYGANSVLLASSGVIDASTTNADERGGDVTIGISWAAQSKIFLQQGTQINVSGGSRGGLSGGTVTFRAPLDGNNDVKIAVLNKDANSSGGFDELPDIDATNNINDRSKVGIIGARSVAVNGFVAFDTTASNAGIDGSSLGWTGTIDTAGWYKGVDQNGVPIPATEGSWTNVTGWRISSITEGGGLASVPAPFAIKVGDTTVATVTYVAGVRQFTPQQIPAFSQFSPGQTNIPVIFPPPQTPGGVTAQGTASVNAAGVVSITITNPGSGYTSRVASVTIGGISNVLPASQFGGQVILSNLRIVSAGLSLAGNGIGYDGAAPSAPALQGWTVNFERTSGLTGKTILVNGTPQFVPDTSYIPVTSSGVFAFDPANQGKDGVANFTGGAGTGAAFFGDTVSQITQGKWSFNGQNYGFTNLFTRLNPLVQSLGADVVHVQPGVELVNSNGAITVASNWNLAAGTAGNLQTRTNPVTGTTFTYFDPNLSHISFDYRLVTPWGGLDSGALTLRAAGNINVNASISDGFFQTGNYLDANYQAWVRSYLASASTTTNNPRLIDAGSAGLYTYYLNNVLGGAVPDAPYNPAANGISPTSRDLVTADLFPHALRVCMGDCTNIKVVTSPSSWSYGFTAGADLSSANPNARISLAAAAQGSGRGDIVIGRHTTYQQETLNVQFPNTTPTNVTVNIPVMIRTGTGGIAISAARDVLMATADPANPDALTVPGVIYAAGVNTKSLADPQYSLQTVNGVTRVVVGNPDPLEKNNLFFEPRILAYGNDAPAAGLYYGPPTAAAFPEKGGDVVIDAQRDIKGYVGTSNKAPQYYQPWLLSNTSVTPSGNVWGAGVFAPTGTQIASQSAWWIQYGSFQQGILSAGGNVSVFAGRDLVDVSVSAPTTGRVSGGLSADSTPVTHLYGSGNMVVRAGGNILGGSFYEGSGHASIVAGGDIGQSGTVSRFNGSALKLPDVPLLAVDTGQIAMVANGAITMAGVVNPAALHVQSSSRANPLDGSTVPAEPLYMDTYGPDSKVSLVARRGNLTITIAPPTIQDANGPNGVSIPAAPSMYPASFDARALNGNLVTTGIAEITNNDPSIGLKPSTIPMPGIILSPSRHGVFNLLAQGSVDLTFGYKNSTPPGVTARPVFSAGPSLMDAAFDPFRPNSGNNEPSSRAILAHEDDVAAGLDTTARIYAATGDITATGTYGQRLRNTGLEIYQRIEINRPTKVYAGRDLIDLNIIVQNIRTSDVSSITAGRNISYTGFNNAGGLHVAGSGFLVVQAGGDIGPFLPGVHNNSSEARVQEGIISVGNSSPTAVGNFFVEVSGGGGSGGIYNQSLLGPKSNPRRNALLTQAAGTRTGADIITMFGTKFGIDYQAVINAYVNPVKAAGVEYNYAAELQAFLRRIGKSANVTDADTAFAAFEKLPADLQHVFAAQVFSAELKAVAVSQLDGKAQSQRGYNMVNTMFPSSFGYTANALGGGTLGASQLVKTGDLNLLHGTIQTKLGGDISVFGPGGNISVGSLAAEPNSNLKLPDLGILTLGGGSISTFTDQSVRVNASRVLTSQGGEISMWSSNGDLDAGRGSKTISSAPALQVLIDQDDYRSIDLSGFVTGSGIQTLRASRVATAANIYLQAPVGTIDAGTAGIGGSGVVVVIAPVIANAGNIQAQGGTVGISTVAAPNIGALTSGSNTAGAATRTADAPTASGNSARASVFMVEVIGYGGGDGQSTPSADDEECKKSQDGCKQ